MEIVEHFTTGRGRGRTPNALYLQFVELEPGTSVRFDGGTDYPAGDDRKFAANLRAWLRGNHHKARISPRDGHVYAQYIGPDTPAEQQEPAAKAAKKTPAKRTPAKKAPAKKAPAKKAPAADGTAA